MENFVRNVYYIRIHISVTKHCNDLNLIDKITIDFEDHEEKNLLHKSILNLNWVVEKKVCI